MYVTYLGHSGFLVETDTAFYIFDYVRGDLTPACLDNTEKPVFILVSHFHEDHFQPMIFDLHDRLNHPLYLLSRDTIRTQERRRQHQAAYQQCLVMCAQANRTWQFDGITIETLLSTDEGVAFLIKEPDGIIYHAGDLNWWHWEEADEKWNRQMAGSYKHEIDKLKGLSIDLAFVPIDPRLGNSYGLGADYLLRKTAVTDLYPMHFWEQYDIIDRFIREQDSRKWQKNPRIHHPGRD